MEKTIRVLTLYQPWASLLAHGIKLNETRPSATSHTSEKGTYLIHAAKRWTKTQQELCLTEPFKTELIKLHYLVDFIDPKTKKVVWKPMLSKGQIIGSFEVKECVKVSGTFEDNGHIATAFAMINTDYTFKYPELYYGDYSKGRSIWIGQNHKRIKPSFDYKGGQGYYQKYKGDINLL